VSRAPDFIEPAAGYRAWRLGHRDELLPFGAPAAPWARGVNEATCERHFLGWRPTTSHAAPAPDCTCGFYALHDPGDKRLDFYTRAGHGVSSPAPAVGAIAAWGDMEVHRTGFRAQFACVIALAEHPRMSRSEREAVWRAAERYGVPLVPWGELRDAALREAAPLPPLDPDPPLRRRRPRAPVIAHVGELGVCSERHVWVRHDGREVGLGITRALARLFGEHARIVTVPSGTEVRCGETVAAVYGTRETLFLSSPVSGKVTGLSDALRRAPEIAGADATHTQWLMRLKPGRWNTETLNLVWGAAGRVDYRATLQDLAVRGRDPYASLRRPASPAGPMRTWAEAWAELQALRNRPVYADAESLYSAVGTELERALAGDERLRSSLTQLDMTVRYEMTEPEATVTLELRPPAPKVACGDETRERADIAFRLTGNTLHRYRRGQLDVAAAVRRGELGIEGSRTRALMASSVLGRLWHARGR
jgi:glycine cleavage system H lipoate-binding protein